jgi:hypothetical protein
MRTCLAQQLIEKLMFDKRLVSGNSAEIVLVMECESGRQGTEYHRTNPGCVCCMVSLVLLLSSMISVESTCRTWAAVYECVDAGGKPVLTNKPAQLHTCRMLNEGTDSELTPSEASTPPQELSPPIRADRPTRPSHVPPMPSNLPTPCPPGLNPLNPLSAPPCVRSNQSGAQPPQPDPAPSP